MPEISVVMGVYNECKEYICAAIDSVLNQTFSDFEFIIILDNPNNDEIRSLLEYYKDKDPRIKLIFNDVNLGLAKSLNKGIQRSVSPYIARMDADDISCPNRFEMQYSYLQKNVLCDVIASNAIYIDENGNRLNKHYPVINNREDFCNAILYANMIMHPTVMFKKESVCQIGGYRDFKASQDYDLWLRLIKNGAKFKIIEAPLLYYRIRSNSIGQSNAARQRAHHLYAVYLYKNEISGKELFSEQNRDAFFNKIQLGTKPDQERYNKALRLYYRAKEDLSKKRLFRGSLGIFRSFITHREIFRTFFEGIKYKKIINGCFKG